MGVSRLDKLIIIVKSSHSFLPLAKPSRKRNLRRPPRAHSPSVHSEEPAGSRHGCYFLCMPGTVPCPASLPCRWTTWARSRCLINSDCNFDFPSERSQDAFSSLSDDNTERVGVSLVWQEVLEVQLLVFDSWFISLGSVGATG